LDLHVLEHLQEVLTESLARTAMMLPLLFVVLLVVEAVSHTTASSKVSRAFSQPFVGPLAAAILGLIPQCGFSVAATTLFLEGMIPLGSLIAAYISTSDDRCAIWVQADDKHLRMVAGSSAFGAKFKNDVRLLIDGSIAGMCYRTGKPSLDDDAPSDPHFQHLREDRHSYSSLICAPIMLEQGHCLGVLSIDAREKGAFTQEDVEIVEAYAEMASMIMTAYLLSLSSVEPFRESLKEVAATGVSTRSKRQRTEKPS